MQAFAFARALCAALMFGAVAFASAAPPLDDPSQTSRIDAQDKPSAAAREDTLVSVADAPGSMAAIKANFDAFDKNGDGYIDKQEASLDPRLTSQFDALDANHDGKLSVTEYMSANNVAEFRPKQGRTTTDGGHD